MEPTSTHVYTLEELRDYRLSRLRVELWLDSDLAETAGRIIDVSAKGSGQWEPGALTLDEAYARAGALVSGWLRANREEREVLESLRLAVTSRTLDLVEAT